MCGVFFYVRYSRNNVVFSNWAETFFLGFSDLLKNEMTNNLYVCDCVILWPFCVCNASCVLISISEYLPMSTKFGANVPQCNTSGYFFVFFFSNFKFLRFLLTFSVFWDLAIFWGENQTTSKSNFYGFYGINGPL